MGKQSWMRGGRFLLLGIGLMPYVAAWATEPLEAGPPVPVQAGAMPVAVPDWLVPVEAVRMDRGHLQIMVRPGTRLTVKPPFALDHPGRLVIDMPGIRLGNNGFPFQPSTIGDVPVRAVRFGQLDLTTVRVVIETDEPDRLQASVVDNRLVVSEVHRPKSFLNSMARYLFGERPPTQQAQKPDSSSVVSWTTSRTVPTPPPKPVAALPPAAYPDLSNLRKLEAQAGYMPNGLPLDRGRVMDIARSQLGLSKDANPDYVNQTFSLGKDNEWCADFVSTVLNWAGGSPWGHLSRVQDIYGWGVSNNRLTRLPEPADVVVFSYGGSSFDHVALVESVNPDGTFTTIGGNEGHAAAAYKTSGSVERSLYKLDDRRILGFVDPIVPRSLSGNAPPPPLPSPPF
jgi:hypothetical protein